MPNKIIAHIKTSKYSPIAIAMLLGLLMVVLLPPLLPPHTAVYTTREMPLNYMDAYYTEAPNIDSIRSVPFVTKSLSAMGIDFHHRDVKPAYSFSDYNAHYNPLPPPKRDWIYIADLDADNKSEVVYISYENDTNVLYVMGTQDYDIKQEKRLPIEGEIFYYRTRYFQQAGNDMLYISLSTKSEERKMLTTLLAYNYKSNKVELLHQFSQLMQSYMLKGYEEKMLLIDNVDASSFEFNIYDLASGEMKSFKIDKQKKDDIKPAQVTSLDYPYSSVCSFLFLKRKRELSMINIDSLFCKQAIVIEPLPLKGKSRNMRLQYVKGNTVFYTIKRDNGERELYKYDIAQKRLSQIRQKEGGSVGSVIFYGDIDKNGVNDIVFTDIRLGKEAICVQQEGSFYDILRYPVTREKLKITNVVLMDGKLVFDSKGIQHWLNHYQKNPRCYLRWFIYLGIIGFCTFLGFVVQQVRENRAYRRQEANNKILHLQLENVQKRIDPHFIFNSLNNLGSLILEGESNESYDYLSKVSGVLNKALRNRSVLISIEEELNFCTSVLDAQRQRFKGKFDYEVYVDQEVQLQWQMPSNILNSMVDNCIKHGFAGIDYMGMISIELLRCTDGFLIVVEDNGKGREAAQADRDQSKSTGTGLDICEQYVRLLNTGRKSSLLSFEIIDLRDEDLQPAGTRCEYFVPNGLTEHT